jgi:hypothetical protein
MPVLRAWVFKIPTQTGESRSRRYLRRTPSGDGKPGPAFEIDPGKLAGEARFDGVFVLRTNARVRRLGAGGLVAATGMCTKR